VALHCQVDGENALQTLQTYSGAARRFEHKGQAGGVVVIDDYAHHPTEVAATLAAARRCYPQQRIWAVFQPHTFSRTRQLLPQLAESFVDADQVLVTDIYAAREQDDGSVHARQLVAACSHPHIDYVGGREQAVARLADAVSPGDVVVTLGAGDSNQIGEWLLATLKDTSRAKRGTHAKRTV
ncbi:MAG: glutamate ligase domain-containing protein, partial [Caldilinea sp.]